MKTYITMLLLQCVLAAIIVVSSGCAGETGWRFEIGVSPVKELSNTAGLKQAPPERAKY